MPRLFARLFISAALTLWVVQGSVSAQEPATVNPTVAKDVQVSADKAAATERALYIVTMNLIEREWNLNNVGRVRELLQETKDSKYRGFEWGYWNRLCHLDRMTLTGHAGGVISIAYSTDGKRIVTGSWDDKTAQVRDAETGKILRTLKHKSGVTSVAFSPDGKRVATCSSYTVLIWEVETGNQLFTIAEHHGVIRAVFSPDGTRIATAGLDGWAKLFDARSGAEILTIKERSVGSLYSIAFSPDSKRFASGNDDNTALVWDTETGALVVALKGHTASIASVAFTPDSKRLLTGSWDKTAKIWEIASGKELFTLRSHTGCVSTVAVSSDGKQLVTGSLDSSARLWDSETGREIQAIKGHTDGIASLAIAPNAKRLVTGSYDTTTKVWDVEAGKEVAAQPGRGGRLVLAADRELPLRPKIGPSKLPFPLNGIGIVRTISPDGKRVARPLDKIVEVWEIETGKLLCKLEGHKEKISVLAFSADSNRIVTGSGDNTAKVWNAVSGKVVQTFKGHTGAVNAVTFFPDGQHVLTGSMDASARVWDVESGQELHQLLGTVGEVYMVAVPANSRRIVTGGRDGAARVWDGDTGRPICVLPGQSGTVATMLTFSPDGSRIVTTHATPILWDGQTGKQIGALRGMRGTYFPTAFSPDSSRLVVAGLDGLTKLYDAETGKETVTFPLPGERVYITHIAFSRDGKCLLVRNGDNPPIVFASDPEKASSTVTP